MASPAALRSSRVPLGEVTPQLAREWSELVDACGADLSMGPEWFTSTARARDVQDAAGVFILRRGSELVGALPYVRRQHRLSRVPVSAAEAPGSYLVAYHPQIVAADSAALLKAVLQDCLESYDVLVLPNLVVGSDGERAVHEFTREHRLTASVAAGHESPYLTIATDWNGFVAAKDKKFRYKVRNSLKELEAAGRVEEEWFTQEAALPRFIEHMLHIESRSWKARAGMAISGDAMEGRYYDQLLPHLARRDALRANVLQVDGRPVAYSLCYRSRGAFRQLKTSFDDTFSKQGAGSAVMQSSIRCAFESGAVEFDFLGDAMPHKNQWATGIRRHTTIQVFLPTWRGRLAGGLRQLADRMRFSQAAATAATREAIAKNQCSSG